MEWELYEYGHEVMVAQSGVYRIRTRVTFRSGVPTWCHYAFYGDEQIKGPQLCFTDAQSLCESHHKAKLEAAKPKEPEPEYKWAPCWCLLVRGKQVGAVNYCPSHTAPFRASITGTSKEWGDFTLRATKESIEKYLGIKTK